MSYNKKVIILVSGILALLLLIIVLSVFVRRGGYDSELRRNLEDEGRYVEEAEEYQEELESEHEFITHLPYYGNGFEVHYGIEDHDNFDVFYEIILRPESHSNDPGYENEVEELAERARQWITSTGVDTDELSFDVIIN